MKIKIWAFALLFLAGLLSCQSNASSTSQNETQTLRQQDVLAVSLDTEEWIAQMEKSPGNIIDVRTEEEFEAGYIEGAHNVNVLESTFIDDLNALSLNKSESVYVYCRSGSRSKRAMTILKDQGFVKIYELDHGIMGWQQAGKPIKK